MTDAETAEQPPVMDEPTHDLLTQALLHLNHGRTAEADVTIRDALDRLEDGHIRRANIDDVVAKIKDVWVGHGDFEEGDFPYVAFIIKQDVADMEDADWDEYACIDELADISINAIRMMIECDYDPWRVIQDRLEDHEEKGTDALVEAYQYRFETRERSDSVAAAIEIEQRLDDLGEATGTWITWPTADLTHHSVAYDGHIHRTACGHALDNPPWNVTMDAEDLPNSAELCGNCRRTTLARIIELETDDR